jgi:hypothetical protein
MAKTEIEKELDRLDELIDEVIDKVDYCSFKDGSLNEIIPVNKMIGLILEHLGLRVASRDQYILVKKILRRD